MARLTAHARSKLQSSQFALPGDRFPIENDSHARAAISGASRAEHAGNISPAEKQTVDRKARAVLHHPRHK